MHLIIISFNFYADLLAGWMPLQWTDLFRALTARKITLPPPPPNHPAGKNKKVTVLSFLLLRQRKIYVFNNLSYGTDIGNSG